MTNLFDRFFGKKVEEQIPADYNLPTRRAFRYTFSELIGSEERLELYWNEILNYLRRDLAYIWTDEVKADLKKIEDEDKKLAFIFKRLNSHYKRDQLQYKEERKHLRNLIWEINRLYTKGQKLRWMRRINSEIQNIIKDVEGEKKWIKSAARKLLKLATFRKRQLWQRLKSEPINITLPDSSVEVYSTLLKNGSIKGLKDIAADVWVAKQRYVLRNAEYLLSPLVYDTNFKVYCFLAWVRTTPKGKYYFNVFYQSHSQGIWRVAFAISPTGLLLKSRYENAVNLPNDIQVVLSKLITTTEPRQRSDFMVYLIPVSTSMMPTISTENSHFMSNIRIFDINLIKTVKRKQKTLEPGNIKFRDLGYYPDFSTINARYMVKWPLYDSIYGTLLPSRNKEFEYLFIHDINGRIWLGNVNVAASPICRYGTRIEIVKLPFELMVCAFDYRENISKGYVGGEFMGRYDATSYLDKIPMIQDFRKTFNIQKNY